MHKAFNTKLTELLGCQYPIVQTAMGWVADPKLVAATCNAGAFGFLAGATIPPEEVEKQILQTKALTDKPFGMNYHMYQPNAEEITDLVIKHNIRAVSYSRSPGPEMIKKLKDAGVVCMPTVGLVKHAIKAVELGADVITIQGGEGGGHTGPVPTNIVLPQVLDAVKVPVVACGGFKDGRGLAAALAYGASGIAMGTRFLMSKESPVPSATLQRYLDTKNPADIIVSTAVDGMPQRMILNEFLSELEHAGALRKLIFAMKNALAFRQYTGASIMSLSRALFVSLKEDGLTPAQAIMQANAPMIIQKAMVDGKPAEGVLPSGQIAGAINSLETCETIINSIIQEAEARLKALQN
jgi:NAD(P)H-dependent flavin oxidoreductase YrpB (nitropropane dioxygenase family)